MLYSIKRRTYFMSFQSYTYKRYKNQNILKEMCQPLLPTQEAELKNNFIHHFNKFLIIILIIYYLAATYSPTHIM